VQGTPVRRRGAARVGPQGHHDRDDRPPAYPAATGHTHASVAWVSSCFCGNDACKSTCACGETTRGNVLYECERHGVRTAQPLCGACLAQDVIVRGEQEVITWPATYQHSCVPAVTVDWLNHPPQLIQDSEGRRVPPPRISMRARMRSWIRWHWSDALLRWELMRYGDAAIAPGRGLD